MEDARLKSKLKLLTEAEATMSSEDIRSFENYFIGALSALCPHNEWVEALASASRALANSKGI